MTRLPHVNIKNVQNYNCVVYWKPYCEQVPFDPLKCKKDWCVEI